MNGFKKIFPIFLSHYATFFAKMAERKVVPFDEFLLPVKINALISETPCMLMFENICDNMDLIKLREAKILILTIILR
jgi:hypothetical protein